MGRRIAGDHEHSWIGERLRRGESENYLTTYWKTSKPGILKLSTTGSRICSFGKSGTWLDPRLFGALVPLGTSCRTLRRVLMRCRLGAKSNDRDFSADRTIP